MTANFALLVENDLQVYAAVRRLKKTRVLELARETKLAKSTVQGALARLHDHSLISRAVVHGVSVVRPRSPSNLLRSLEATRQRANAKHNTRDTLLLNTIRALKAVSPSKPRRQPKRRGK